MSIRHGLWIAAIWATIAVLSGCSFSSGSPTVPSAGGVTPTKVGSGDLLYVANYGASGGVSVLTFPQGKLVTTINNIGAPLAICSDPSGNVWVGVYDSSVHRSFFDEFAHGGTKPIEVLKTDQEEYLAGCAVDPTTGDLAGIGVSHTGSGAEIWPRARKGKPIFRSIPFQPTSCGYDASGNLFVDGLYGSTFDFYFGELPSGNSKTFQYIHFNRYAFGWPPGSIQWDGKYITVGVQTRKRDRWVVYRVQISGKVGTVVGVVHLQDLAVTPHYWIAGKRIVATQKADKVRHLGLYDYPAGGERIKLYSSFHQPVGLTVSVTPK
jgi:hypothetical protein